MHPPLHAICAADAAVQDLLEDAAGLRLYPFGEARPKATFPYAVWQVIHGRPENYLAGTPDADSYITTVDVFSDTWSSARAVAEAIRDALEGSAYVTSYDGETRDAETKAFVVSFTVDWIVNR